MSRIVERIVIFLLLIPLVVWGIYHVAFYAQESVETEAVFSETIARSLSGTGVAVRQEVLLDDVSTGSERYLHNDGTRVGINQPVIEYYSGNVINRDVQNIKAYEDEVLLLEESQNKNLNNFATAPGISKDIREQLSTLSQISATGSCGELIALKSELTHLINRRHIATGKGDDFESRISQLNQEVDNLRANSDSENIRVSTAPVSGFFVKNTDGYETKLSLDQLSHMTIDEVNGIITDSETTSSNHVGKIVTSSRWFFAVAMPVYQIEWVKAGQNTSLSFNHINKAIPAVVSEIWQENNNDTAIIILYSDFISDDVVNLRISDVMLSFSQFTGLKINTSCIRFIEGENGEKLRGVFILENNIARFKLVDPLYEEAGFVISRSSFSDTDKNYVKLFDQIIVGGETDLYDGKAIR